MYCKYNNVMNKMSIKLQYSACFRIFSQAHCKQLYEYEQTNISLLKLISRPFLDRHSCKIY